MDFRHQCTTKADRLYLERFAAFTMVFEMNTPIAFARRLAWLVKGLERDTGLTIRVCHNWYIGKYRGLLLPLCCFPSRKPRAESLVKQHMNKYIMP